MESEDIRATRESMQKLPQYCFVTHPVSLLTVKLIRGVAGFTALDSFLDPVALNASLGITKAQAEAMLAGSMFGWYTRAADPDTYTAEGRPIVTGRSAKHPSRGDRCSLCGAPMNVNHQCGA